MNERVKFRFPADTVNIPNSTHFSMSRTPIVGESIIWDGYKYLVGSVSWALIETDTQEFGHPIVTLKWTGIKETT